MGDSSNYRGSGWCSIIVMTVFLIMFVYVAYKLDSQIENNIFMRP